MATRFDVRDYVRTAHGSLRGEFDRSEFEGFPLDREAIIATAYLRELERAAVRRMRLLLGTAADPRLADFLRTWATEKAWIADALDEVLDASPRIRGVSAPADRPEKPLSASARAGRSILGDDLVTARVSVGAIDAHLLMRGYASLAHLSLHPEMERLAAAIVPILERHAEFFAEEAAGRLGLSSRARTLTRALLRLERLPSGEADLPPELAREGRALVFARDSSGLALLDRALGHRLGVATPAAVRVSRPARSVAHRAAFLLGMLAAQAVWTVRMLAR